MKNELTDNAFCIERIINVVRAAHKSVCKPIEINARHCDVLTYTVSGSCRYVLESGEVINVKEGDVLFLSHTEKYVFSTDEPNYEYFFCDFSFVPGIECKSRLLSPKNKEYTESLFKKLHRRHNTPTTAAKAEALSVFYTVYALILDSANSKYIAKTARALSENAKRKIDLCYNDPDLSVSAVAEEIGISEVYLRRIFKSKTGVSPSQYISRVRLAKARELMSYPFVSLEDCALQSGFSSLQYFSRIFKKEFGISPGKYRRGEKIT